MDSRGAAHRILAPLAVMTLAMTLVGALLAAAPATAAHSGDDERPVAATPDGVVFDQMPAERSSVRKWPGHKITYTSTLPSKWRWSLQHALSAWNKSGGKLKFVKAKKPGRAQLTIGYGNTNGYAGYATIGPARNAYVHLNAAYKRSPADAERRLFVGLLLTHELGHVVGFSHVGRGCQLMVPTFQCPIYGDQPGYYSCRWIDKPLLKSFVKAYGGKAKQAPKQCPIDPIPPQLKSLGWSGGGTVGPVTATWSPASAKPGVRVRILVWRSGDCEYGPVEIFHVSPTAGRWRDANALESPGLHCFRVQVVNQSDGGPSAFTKKLERYRPPAEPPVISNIVWDEGQNVWTFSADWEDDAILDGYTSQADGGCPDASEATYSYSFFHGDPEPRLLYAFFPDQCVTFVVTTSGGRVSPPVNVQFSSP